MAYTAAGAAAVGPDQIGLQPTGETEGAVPARLEELASRGSKGSGVGAGVRAVGRKRGDRCVTAKLLHANDTNSYDIYYTAVKRDNLVVRVEVAIRDFLSVFRADGGSGLFISANGESIFIHWCISVGVFSTMVRCGVG